MLPAAIGDSNAVIDTVPFTVLNTAEGDQSFYTLTLEVTPGTRTLMGPGTRLVPLATSRSTVLLPGTQRLSAALRHWSRIRMARPNSRSCC